MTLKLYIHPSNVSSTKRRYIRTEAHLVKFSLSFHVFFFFFFSFFVIMIKVALKRHDQAKVLKKQFLFWLLILLLWS